jgi:hypothetical protein
MFLVVKGFDTLSLHPFHTGVELLIIASRRNSPKKKLTLTKLANYRNVWFEELPVPRERIVPSLVTLWLLTHVMIWIKDKGSSINKRAPDIKWK